MILRVEKVHVDLKYVIRFFGFFNDETEELLISYLSGLNIEEVRGMWGGVFLKSYVVPYMISYV